MLAFKESESIPQAYAAREGLFSGPKRIVILIILIALIASAVAYLVQSGTISHYVVNLVGQGYLVDSRKLPLDVEYLTNPILDEFRVGVEGVVTSKDEKYFTIEGRGGSLKIYFEGDSLTHIWSHKLKRELTLAELPINAKVRGSVWIYKEGPEKVVGSLFDVDDQPAP